jgi:hypothetical protein
MEKNTKIKGIRSNIDCDVMNGYLRGKIKTIKIHKTEF